MKTVFTNGCFDLIHDGHIYCLDTAAAFGQRLVVGINTDASIKRLKGPHRPLLSQEQRMAVVASLRMVDDVYLFDEDTPARLIAWLQPDIIVKGGDYDIDTTVGIDWVLPHGISAAWVPLRNESTTRIIRRACDNRSG